ncbi:MAG: lipid-A-disaccharide synthase [Thiobacillaceae bacterium]|nr:lipid-A-disaccharide synthase [Thiobacillaceae bacterium]
MRRAWPAWGPTLPSPLTPPPSPPAPEVAIVAGESSGDQLGALLMQALQEAGYACRFQGIAGPRMQGRGAISWYDMETLAVRGYLEAMSSLRRILAIRRDLRRRLLAAPPRLYIGIDAPDFNLGLEAALKRAGIPTVQFVGPTVWGWRRGRLRRVRQAVSHMLLIFPFEEELYRRVGIPASYVGHPLAYALPQRDQPRARERLGLDPEAEYIALLPGSRASELKALAAVYVETARRVLADRPGVRFLVPLVTRATREMFVRAIGAADAHELPLRILYGHAHDALQAADAALVASGTATLEALLLGCPHVITYRVPWLTYQIMKRQAYLPYVGMPNILAGRFLVPEHLQDAARPEVLADALLALLRDQPVRAAMQSEFARLRAELTRDTPRLIAEALAPYLT